MGVSFLIPFTMNTSSISSVRNQLKEIAEENKGIRSLVAREAIDYTAYEPADFFNDLLNYGCCTGIISSLIYYCDTHKFYDTHYDEIEELRIEFEELNGMPIIIQNDYKNFMAWFAFEQVTRQLADELWPEI